MTPLMPGWAMANFGQLIESMSNGMPGTQNKEGRGVAVSRIETIADQRIDFSRVGYIAEYEKTALVRYQLSDGDVLFSHINSPAHIGKTAIFSGERTLYHGINLLRIRVDRRACVPSFFNYACKLLRAKGTFSLNAQHAVNQSSLNQTKIAAFNIPLPPVHEQQRIADKLDTVLARVETVNARLASVAPLLKRFRQSVLAAATSGRLTADWRSEVNKDLDRPAAPLVAVELPAAYKRLSKQVFKPTKIPFGGESVPASWLVCTVGELYKANVLIDFADGNHGSLYPRKEEFGNEGAVFLTATQMGADWRVNLSECPRLSHGKASQLVKGWAKHGDVLLSHNATVGRVGILDSPAEDVLLGTSVTFYRFNPNHFCAQFACVVFSSLFFQDQLHSVMAQTTRDQVPITKQVSLNIVFPPLTEQVEISRRVELLFAFADRLEARLQAAQIATSRLTPAMLAKAFRGELVQQDPNDEPAAELLRRLAQNKPDTTARGRKPRAK